MVTVVRRDEDNCKKRGKQEEKRERERETRT